MSGRPRWTVVCILFPLSSIFLWFCPLPTAPTLHKAWTSLAANDFVWTDQRYLIQKNVEFRCSQQSFYLCQTLYIINQMKTWHNCNSILMISENTSTLASSLLDTFLLTILLSQIWNYFPIFFLLWKKSNFFS